MTKLKKRLVRRLQANRRRDREGGRRCTDLEPNRGWIPTLWIALSIAVLDWSVKWAVAQRVPLSGFEEVWSGRVALWHVRNRAMILGLYESLPIGSRKLIAVAAALVGAVLLFEVLGRGHRLLPARRKWVWLFVGLASGGMLGNLGERAIHWGVTDYLSFRWGEIWLPPGNIADIALFLSIPVAVVVVIFELQARAQRQAEVNEEPTSGVLPVGS